MGSAGQQLPDQSGSTSSPALPQTPDSPLKSVFFNQRELRAGWRLLLYLAIALVIGWALGWIVRLISPDIPRVITPLIVIVQDGLLIAIFVGSAAIMARIERRSLADYGLPLRQAIGRNLWLGAMWGIGGLTVLLIVLRMNRSFIFGSIGLGWREALWYGALWALAMYLVGVAEEFMLRGYSQFTLTTGIGFWPAAGLLSLAFAALHLTNPGETVVGISSVVAIGLFFAFTLYRTGTLWFAIGMHAAWNWGQTFLYGVPNSGMVARGHLLNPVIQGPRWYSGGTAGPEGSVLVFPLIALMFVLFDRTFSKQVRYPALAEARRVTPESLEPLAG